MSFKKGEKVFWNHEDGSRTEVTFIKYTHAGYCRIKRSVIAVDDVPLRKISKIDHQPAPISFKQVIALCNQKTK